MYRVQLLDKIEIKKIKKKNVENWRGRENCDKSKPEKETHQNVIWPVDAKSNKRMGKEGKNVKVNRIKNIEKKWEKNYKIRISVKINKNKC